MTDLGIPRSSSPPPIIPESPTHSYVSTTIHSSYNLPLPPPPQVHPILNMADLEASQRVYSDLIQAAKSYRHSLASMSTSASKFGSALEACARLKEARNESVESNQTGKTRCFWPSEAQLTGEWRNCTADSLMSASGVHYLIANHHQILSETIYRSFEIPLMHELDQWRRKVEEEDASYQREAKIMAKEIQGMEKEGMKLHRARKRELGTFRQHLVQLTRKIDGLTGLSDGYGRAVARDCQEMSRSIVDCGASVVRAEVEIYEALARKGWNGGGLDELLEKGRDLFATEDGTERSDKISSILPQNTSILAQEDSAAMKFQPRRPSKDSLVLDIVSYDPLNEGVCDGNINSIFCEHENSIITSNHSRTLKSNFPTLGNIAEVRDPLENWEQECVSPRTEIGEKSSNKLNNSRSLIEILETDSSARLDMDFRDTWAEDDDKSTISARTRVSNKSDKKLSVDEDTSLNS